MFHSKIYAPLYSTSANEMQKQVEIRMHENHLDTPSPPEKSSCGICDKLMKNLLLTLTILGKLLYFSVLDHVIFTHSDML